jgi:hypothetical protein
MNDNLLNIDKTPPSATFLGTLRCDGKTEAHAGDSCQSAKPFRLRFLGGGLILAF